jgi:hypothetical protein
MTFNKTTLPSADTEPAPQYCEDDPCGLDQIPGFLRRTSGKTKRRQRPRTAWRMTPAMKAAAQKDQARRQKIAARSVVLQAVEEGADTFGKVRKATDLSDAFIQSALRFHVKERAILKAGKHYHATAQRRR